MGDDGSPSYIVSNVATKDLSDHRDGRIWEDAVGVLFLTGVFISVSDLLKPIAISDTRGFTHVVFVDATSSSSIEVDVQTWSRTLGNGHEQDIWEDGLRFLSNAPQDAHRQALIFDNADDTTLKWTPFIPKNKSVTLIITSRNCDVSNISTACHLELGEMEMGEALETLLHSARRKSPLPSEEMES